jgi:RNA polymerase sigma-70 factor (ECF subfamily)
VWRVGFRLATKEMKQRRSIAPEVVASYIADPASDELSQAISELRPKPRSVLILHYYAGYSTEEIAQMLGLRPSSVSVILHRARHKLREILGEDDG